MTDKVAAPTLWEYRDEDGKEFYLPEKKTGPVKSPYTGKSFTPKPEKASLSNVGKELKEEGAKIQGALYKFEDAEGKEFYLPEKLRMVHSPYSGKSISGKPERDTLTDVGKDLSKKSASSFAPMPYLPGVTAREPLVDATHAIWQDPTSYNILSHGPPYLPSSVGLGAVKQASMVKQVVADTFSPEELYASCLPSILMALQGLALIHQCHHWLSVGPLFYADHKLFEEIYGDIPSEIDSVAERTVGRNDLGLASKLLSPLSLVQSMEYFVHRLVGDAASSPETFPLVSLNAETSFLDLLQKVVAKMQEGGVNTQGSDNLLAGIADTHETHVYKLKQRVGA